MRGIELADANLAPQAFAGRRQARGITAGNRNLRPFRLRGQRGRKANSRTAAQNHDYFTA